MLRRLMRHMVIFGVPGVMAVLIFELTQLYACWMNIELPTFLTDVLIPTACLLGWGCVGVP
jgi:hypothetical protein